MNTIRELVGSEFAAKPGQEPSPFHKAPSGESLVFKRLAGWVGGDRSDAEQHLIQTLRRYVRIAQPPVAGVTSTDHEATEWHNFAGDFVPRGFIRQQKAGTELAWARRCSPSRVAARLRIYRWRGLGDRAADRWFSFVGGEEKLRFDDA